MLACPGAARTGVVDGPETGVHARLDAASGKVLLGTGPACDLRLGDPTVSRRHAEVHHDGSVFNVNDVGSLNGTYLNRERIESATPSAAVS